VPFAKPTGLLTDVPGFFSNKPASLGWPQFDANRKYTGPLPSSCPHVHAPLSGKDKQGQWRTSTTGAYPADLCWEFGKRLFTDFVDRLSARVHIAPGASQASWSEHQVLPLAGNIARLQQLLTKLKFPDSARQYVTGSSVALGLRLKGNGHEIFEEQGLDPLLIPLINSVLTETMAAGEQPFVWTSLQLNVRTVSDWHKDPYNVGPSAIAVLGDFEKGEFMLEGLPPLQLRGHLLLFDAGAKHRSLPFQGDRFSFVAYCHPCLFSITAKEKGRLKALGFRVEDELCRIPPHQDRLRRLAVVAAGGRLHRSR
jgi:hypothetical protein